MSIGTHCSLQPHIEPLAGERIDDACVLRTHAAHIALHHRLEVDAAHLAWRRIPRIEREREVALVSSKQVTLARLLDVNIDPLLCNEHRQSLAFRIAPAAKGARLE